MTQSRTHQHQYAIYGVLAGFLFPVLGTIIQCSIEYGFFGLSHFLECQLNNPLLWIIDTAPLFLGLLAAFAGRQMDKVREKNLELNEKYIQMNMLRQLADSANKAKGEFLATMSHEIRTPLSAIIGYNNLLKESPLREDQLHLVETIGIATDNLFVIINDILDASRLEAGMVKLEYKSFSLQSLVQNVVRICNDRAISKGLKILLNYDNSIPAHLESDATRLSQILINLMGNAIKFTDAGFVELKVEKTGKTPTSASIRFAVKDTGIGIKKENLDRIFERFTQEEVSTNRLYGGTGLGLHIVRSLLDLFQGKMEVKSEPWEGTEFSFVLDMPFSSDSAPNASAEVTKEEVHLPLEGMNVLLAEDNEFNLFLAETYLRRNGALVSKAENGQEAVKILQARQFDAVLMDIQMPLMDGKEATRIIRSNGIKTPLIACSAHALPCEKAECLTIGMDEYITKPYEEKELIRVLAGIRKNKIGNHMETTGDNIEEILGKIHADVGADFVAIIIQKFMQDMPALIEELNQHLVEMDLKTIQEKTHRLAGTMATFRFPEGLRLARIAEYAARDGKVEEAAEGIGNLNVYLSETLKQLAGYGN